jgi:hypothetical protein
LGKLEVERHESKIAEELLPNTSLGVGVYRRIQQLCENTQPRPKCAMVVACMKSGSADTVIIPIALKDHAYR